MTILSAVYLISHFEKKKPTIFVILTYQQISSKKKNINKEFFVVRKNFCFGQIFFLSDVSFKIKNPIKTKVLKENSNEK